MIIREQGDQLLLIRQTDHAFLAGFFAKEWGNEEFTRPEPFASFCLAAAEHDNGWSEWEIQPTLDGKSRTPNTFMSIPTEEHIALYQKGIERLVKVDHYAALLVSMHCAGLYDRARATMPGFSAKYVKSTETSMVSDFVQRLRLQQLRLKVDLRANPATRDLVVEDTLKANFERLEALDRLSLHLCLNPQENCVIDAVPSDESGHEVDLDLRSEGGNVLTLAPYPFRRDMLEVSIMARRVPKRMYMDDVDFQKTLAQAPYFGIKFTLRARRTNMLHRVANL
ncbi:MAG TPA: DUF3891 family protein [Candidatus Dormibacteraeota bacterium]|nr:DUF3891 family protein [Candidatus Dormibacteraeota bacterium]